jgi:hypothetical protein
MLAKYEKTFMIYSIRGKKMKKYVYAFLLLMIATPAGATVTDLIGKVKNNDVAGVKELLAGGEKAGASDANGNTALHYAVATNNAELTKLLIDEGADVNAKNNKGWSPAMIAEKKNVPEVSAVLRQYEQKNKAVESVAKVKAQTTDKVAEVKTTAENKVAEVKTTAENKAVKTEEKATKVVTDTKEVADKKVTAVKKEAVTTAATTTATAVKTEAPKAETPKAESPKAESPKAEAPKAEAPKTEAPKAATKTVEVKKTQAVKPQVKKAEPSRFSKDITVGTEEVVYCLSYIALQSEEPDKAKAASYYARDNGLTKARYDHIEITARDYFENASADNIAKRADECSQVITPKNDEEMNKIVRSWNKAIGY